MTGAAEMARAAGLGVRGVRGARAPGSALRARVKPAEADEQAWPPRRTVRPPGSSGAALQAAALTFGQAPPDAEPFIVLKCVLKALGADIAGPADLLGLPGGAALLREERLRIRLGTQRIVLPG